MGSLHSIIDSASAVLVLSFWAVVALMFLFRIVPPEPLAERFIEYVANTHNEAPH
jgi:hypothetical protein